LIGVLRQLKKKSHHDMVVILSKMALNNK